MTPSREHVIQGLAAIVGRAHCLTEAGDMAPYLRDWRGLYHGRATAVLRPGSTKQVRDIVEFAAEKRIGIVPQGGNTGLSGGATPDESGDAIVISLLRMRRILELDLENNAIAVEAGCLLADVQTAAGRANRFFPLSLAAEGSCTIGGNLATNAGGINVLKYGMARDLTLGLEVVLPDGRLLSDMKSLRKDNTGYDLKQLFIGSEGTLGIITAAMLKLFPRPHHRLTAIAALSSLDRAPALLARLRSASDDRIQSFELLPRLGLELSRLVHPDLVKPFDPPPDYAILVELASSSDVGELGTIFEQALAEAIAAGEIDNSVIAQSQAQAANMWRWRDGMVDGQHRYGPGIKHDVSVPLSSISSFIDRANEMLRRTHPQLQVLAFGHLGDGNIHYNLLQMPDTSHLDMTALTPSINRIVHDLVAEFGGSISAEHGIGQLRRAEFAERASPVELALMRGVKEFLDPHRIMNPGKVL